MDLGSLLGDSGDWSSSEGSDGRTDADDHSTVGSLSSWMPAAADVVDDDSDSSGYRDDSEARWLAPSSDLTDAMSSPARFGHANEDTHGAASDDYSWAASDSEDSLFSFSSDDYGSGDDTSSSAPSYTLSSDSGSTYAPRPTVGPDWLMGGATADSLPPAAFVQQQPPSQSPAVDDESWLSGNIPGGGDVWDAADPDYMYLVPGFRGGASVVPTAVAAPTGETETAAAAAAAKRNAAAAGRTQTAAAAAAANRNAVAASEQLATTTADLVERICRVRLPTWAEVERMLRDDSYIFRPRPLQCTEDRAVYREAPRRSRRGGGRSTIQKDQWLNSGGDKGSVTWPKVDDLEGPPRLRRRFGKVVRSKPQQEQEQEQQPSDNGNRSRQDLKYLEYNLLLAKELEPQPPSGESNCEALLERRLFVTAPTNIHLKRLRAEPVEQPAAAASSGDGDAHANLPAQQQALSEPLTAKEVAELLQSGGAARLPVRPPLIAQDDVDAAAANRRPLLYYKDGKKFGGRRGTQCDRWKNLGGKNPKALIRIPGESRVALFHRKGKVMRGGQSRSSGAKAAAKDVAEDPDNGAAVGADAFARMNQEFKFDLFSLAYAVDTNGQMDWQERDTFGLFQVHLGMANQDHLQASNGNAPDDSGHTTSKRMVEMDMDVGRQPDVAPGRSRKRKIAAAGLTAFMLISLVVVFMRGTAQHEIDPAAFQPVAPASSQLDCSISAWNPQESWERLELPWTFLSENTIQYLRSRCCSSTGAIDAFSCETHDEVEDGKLASSQDQASEHDRITNSETVATMRATSQSQLHGRCEFDGGESDIETIWHQLDTRTIFTDVNTSSSTFSATPHYVAGISTRDPFSTLNSPPPHDLSTAIARDSPKGFRLYASSVTPGASLSAKTATQVGYQVWWGGELSECTAAGVGGAGFGGWSVYSQHSVRTIVTMSQSFPSTDPAVVVSLRCKEQCWHAAGGSSVYAVSNNQFAVYVYAPTLDFIAMESLEEQLEEWDWQVNWLASDDPRNSGQHSLLQADRFQTTAFSFDVVASDAGHVYPPVYLFSPVSMSPEPYTSECPTANWSACTAPEFPPELKTTGGQYGKGLLYGNLADLFSAQQSFSEQHCGKAAGFVVGGARESCGSYTLSLGTISQDGKDTAVEITINCTYVTLPYDVAKLECPGVSTVFTGSAISAQSVTDQGFRAYVTTYHPPLSLTPSERLDLKIGRSVQTLGSTLSSVASNMFSIKWLSIRSRRECEMGSTEASSPSGGWSNRCMRVLSSSLYSNCRDFLPSLSQLTDKLTCSTSTREDAGAGEENGDVETFDRGVGGGAQEGDGMIIADGSSCVDILRRRPDAPDGTYLIQLAEENDEEEGSNRPFPVFCDMTKDDGGWTLVYKIAGSSAMATNASVNREALASTDGRLESPGVGKLSDGAIRELCTEQYRVLQTGGGDNTPTNGVFCTFHDVSKYCDGCGYTGKACDTTYRADARYPHHDTAGDSPLDSQLSRGFSYYGEGQGLVGATVLQLAFDDDRDDDASSNGHVDWRSQGKRGSPRCLGCCASGASDALLVETPEDDRGRYVSGRGSIVQWEIGDTLPQMCEDSLAMDSCSAAGGCSAQVWCRSRLP